MFNILVDPIRERLVAHHYNYSTRCKAEMWEEVCAKALRETGFGSDWKPDNNHVVGVDQTTDCGIKISNKSGFWNRYFTALKYSGSRLTSHATLDDKLAFLANKTEDYVFCLASNSKTSKNYNKTPVYHFSVIDTSKLDYQNAVWETMLNKSTGKISSYKGVGVGYTATISCSMSDQVWTTVDRSLVTEIYEITV